MLLNYSTINVI